MKGATKQSKRKGTRRKQGRRFKNMTTKEWIARVKAGKRASREFSEMQEVEECLRNGNTVLQAMEHTGLTAPRIKSIIKKISNINKVSGEDIGRIVGGVLGAAGEARLGVPGLSEVGAEAGALGGKKIGELVRTEVERQAKKKGR